MNEQCELTVNDAFINVLSDWDYKVYLLIGGYGSGKSNVAAQKLITKLLVEKRKAMVVRATYASIKDSCYDLIYEELSKLDLVRDENLKEYRGKYVIAKKSPLEFNFPNGSKIIFKGVDNVSRIKSINDISIVWIEECSEVDYKAFKELRLRLRSGKQDLHYLLTTNPVEQQNWVYTHYFIRINEDGTIKTICDDKELYRRKTIVKGSVYYHHSTPDDNFFLDPSYIKELDELKDYDPDLYRVARQGQFGVNGKKVLPQLTVATNSAEFKAAVSSCKLKRIGMDFGFMESYNACIPCAVDTKNSILYIYDEFYRNKMTDTKTVVAMREWRSDIDKELIKGDSAEPKTIKFYQESGYRMIATRKITRIEQVKKIKRFKKIIVSPRCKNVIRELGTLVFKEDSNGNIIPDEFNIDPHTLSAIWYALDDITVADVKERKFNSKKG